MTNPTAIVIDDNEDVRDVFVDLLKIYNVDIIGVGSNGGEAIELYQKYHPDFVFIDTIMPLVDGFTGSELIKNYNPQATVILVTGAFIDPLKIKSCKADSILEKPVNLQKVQEILNKFCIH